MAPEKASRRFLGVKHKLKKGERSVAARASSHGWSFIKLYLLKVSAGAADGGGVSEAKAHIPGLGRIQLERIHKAGTGTKLLAVLV